MLLKCVKKGVRLTLCIQRTILLGAFCHGAICVCLFGNIIGSLTLTIWKQYTVYPKKYAHGFVVLCFVVVMQSFIMNSHEVFIHIHQGCFAGTGAIVRLPQCQWSKPDGVFRKVFLWQSVWSAIQHELYIDPDLVGFFPFIGSMYLHLFHG